MRNEKQVIVTLTRGYWVGRYEVTQEQWTKEFQKILPTSPVDHIKPAAVAFTVPEDELSARLARVRQVIRSTPSGS